MSRSQSLTLFSGSEINSDQVLMTDPNTVLILLSCPSARDFFNEMISLRGITSCAEFGRATVRIANGIARITLVGASAISGAIDLMLTLGFDKRSNNR